MDFNYDILLEYLSYKKNGRWQEFKSIIHNLNYSNSTEINHNKIRRMLSSLGHVEFLFDDKEHSYVVAPSGICLLNNSFIGVLCGYRTKDFLYELEKELRTFNIEYEEQKQISAPTAIFINFKNYDKIDDFAQNNTLGLYITKNFTNKLLKNLPSTNQILMCAMQNKISLDLNASNVYYLDSYIKKMIPAKGRGIGHLKLFEQRYYDRNKYYISYEGECYQIDKNYAYCLIYANSNKKYLKYKNNKLYVKKIKMPELIDRALTLSSGLNKEYLNYDNYFYDNINLDTARMVAQKTGLSLEIIDG